MDKDTINAINAILDEAMQDIKKIEQNSYLRAIEEHLELPVNAEKDNERQQLLNRCIESALNLNLWHKNRRIDLSRIVHQHGFYTGLSTMASIFDDIHKAHAEYT